MKSEQQLLTRIKQSLVLFMIGLALSGITAFPLKTELDMLIKCRHIMPEVIAEFITKVHQAITLVNDLYPFMAYGTDWLAFAHLMLTVLFIGPYRNPVKNIWAIEFGMFSCLAVFPLAFICGAIRGIPFYWQLLDCSFGFFGLIPLLYAHKLTKQLTHFQTQSN